MTVITVCTTCRRTDADPAGPRPGAQLHAALSKAPLPEGVSLRAVECLSACGRGCAVSIGAPGKWSYVYGDIHPETHVDQLLDGAARYHATEDGQIPWRERPEILRKQVIARIPPLPQKSRPQDTQAQDPQAQDLQPPQPQKSERT
ncbi:DUF1636 family protein [Phaeovulum vinaykumarii]|uniref:Predicted metal-binding protein n=1 Tax=Phaeovulum vinaykumarii TaxID=407234 RepID=A0A1N7KCF9_9RHOB|nr:DUF1636 domain-containing protein [Phaeovulum vinaykumarii]SIS59229.1 Predicted metal-binding protein [Phaeovulum vinaykumarii]SOB94050.1 predicted metal-binding protein [Phaeovulum vinaykumarii]